MAANRRKTVLDIQKMKAAGEPIAMLTAYDVTSARLSERAGVPMLLVGDTLGMVIQGHSSTIPVTLEQMIYHAGIVVRSTETPLIVGDLPFGTYTVSEAQALETSIRLMQESGVSAVKLEGGVTMAPAIERIVAVGIPVMAHIGLTPQSVNSFGGFKVQGRDIETARQLMRDAEAVQAAGAFAVVLELVPTPLATAITERLDIPTIGIGAGVGTDGQVQVFHDILGLFDDFVPRHTQRYAEIGAAMQDSIGQYVADVSAREFPTASNAFGMRDEVLSEVLGQSERDQSE
ncbi:MAG: 3-methyl-2-oxobutanoate hydroxymethyltransferase [Chloroflexota bacterium]